MHFSVLLSIYNKEQAEYFDRAMYSIWDEQTVKPNEIVLVQDGPLPEALNEVIKKWQIKLQDLLRIIPLEHNVGLGDALNIGLNACSFDLVARMDTDDIAMPTRFEQELKIFQNNNIDICSSWVSEFDEYEAVTTGLRKVPQYHQEIVRFAKKRNPINHPAVMYKKSSVIKSGGYKRMIWFEDYYLWIRMITKGCVFYNIQVPLVHMRAGTGQLQRRRGMMYVQAEIDFLRTVHKIGFLTTEEFLYSLVGRTLVRMVPLFITSYIYRLLRS